MIIYQTFTLYINISETDLQCTISLYSLSNCYNTVIPQTESNQCIYDLVKRFLVTKVLPLSSHTVDIHVIPLNTAASL